MKKLISIGMLVLFIGTVNAGDPHHSSIIYEQSSEQIININECSPYGAIEGASGQHHYKATTHLQWSVAGAFTDGECNDSAASFGLGLQAGEVFTAANFSSNGKENMIGISASGTF